jgi:hypothetical protein
MFWTKEKITVKPSTPPEMKKLIIKFTDGSKACYNSPYKKGDITPLWLRNFYKWYFGRVDSAFYTMKHKSGGTTFLRKNIYEFTVEIK